MRVVLLACLGFLAACASIPPSEGSVEQIEVPTGWSLKDGAGAGASLVSEASLATWWERFDDPRLSALVRTALKANSTVQGALAALQQAQALRDVATASLLPSLASSASVQRGHPAGQATANHVQVGLDASWTVDLFGARRAAAQASEATVGASEASLGNVQVQVAAEVALNYILLRTVQARALIADSNLASLQETQQLTSWRLQAGLVTALEAEQARAAVEQSRAQRATLQTSIVQTQHALDVLTGRSPQPSSEGAGLQPTPGVPQARDGLAIGIPAETLRQRADVRAAEYEVAAALARVGQAQAQRWPSFAIGGSVGLSAATLGALSSSAMLGSVLASVKLPVFDGGALRAQVRVQQAALELAKQQYRASVLGALQQVEDALVALRGDRLRLASLRLAAEAATNAALLARQRYGSGLIDFQTVLETQRTQFATLDGVAIASADVSSDHVRLFKALGGGWTSPFPPKTP